MPQAPTPVGARGVFQTTNHAIEAACFNRRQQACGHRVSNHDSGVQPRASNHDEGVQAVFEQGRAHPVLGVAWEGAGDSMGMGQSWFDAHLDGTAI